MIYVSLAVFISTFMAMAACYYLTSKKAFIFATFSLFFPFLIFLLRTYEQPDFENYSLIYDGVVKYDSWLMYIRSIEPGFLTLLKVLGFAGLDYKAASNVIFFLICFLFSYSTFQHRDIVKGEAYILAFLIFSSYYFHFLSLNVVRQGLAIAFFSVGISKLISDRKNYLLFFILSFLFHYSSILVVACLYVAKILMRKVSIKVCIYLIVLSLLVGVFDLINYLPLPDVLADRVTKLRYYSESNLSSYAKLAFYCSLFAYYIVNISITRNFERIIFFFGSSYLCLVLLFMHYGEFLDRLIMYSIVFSAFVFVDIYRTLKPKYLSCCLLFLYCSLSYCIVMLSPSLKVFFE